MPVFDDRESYSKYFSNLHLVVNKEDKICELCQGKTVLDLGCIDHSYTTALELGDAWLHERIKKVAKKVIGTDILVKDIKQLNKRGFKILKANAETMELKCKFDVIVAGDLVEHLSNIGMFFDAIKRHMHKKSIVIISTPNPFNVDQFLCVLFDNRIAVNPEHSVWLDPKVMFETVRRSGLIISEFYWTKTRWGCFVQSKKLLAMVISRLLRKFRPSFERDYLIILKQKGG